MFAGTWGSDIVTDFEDNLDVLDLRGAATSFAALQIVQQGADVLVSLTGFGAILLTAEVAGNITAADISFS